MTCAPDRRPAAGRITMRIFAGDCGQSSCTSGNGRGSSTVTSNGEASRRVRPQQRHGVGKANGPKGTCVECTALTRTPGLPNGSCRSGTCGKSAIPCGQLNRPRMGSNGCSPWDNVLKSRMCGPQVRFCERRRGASPSAYSTAQRISSTGMAARRISYSVQNKLNILWENAVGRWAQKSKAEVTGTKSAGKRMG